MSLYPMTAHEDTPPRLPSPESRDTLQTPAYTSVPLEDDPNSAADARAFLPKPSFPADPSSGRNSDIYNQSSSPSASNFLLSKTEAVSRDVDAPGRGVRTQKRRRAVILIAIAVLVVVIVAVMVPVYFTVIKPKSAAAAGGSGGDQGGNGTHPTGSPGSPGSKTAVWGGDGSTVTSPNGTTFTYNNKFGGIWYYDPDDPYNNNAYPNSWTPPLNKSWNFNTDRIFGVNLGGWFVLEPFISPVFYQRYPPSNDEWTLSTAMAADTANGGLNQIEEHYKTFITEDDFAEIAGAGLNWVRIPIPFWSIDVWNNEPFLAKASWKYIVQALQWCRKYGLRVKFDLHTVPGSQNGYNHSGMYGAINFLRGTMGLANAQRILNYIRIFTEFFTQPEWKDIVVLWGIMNEPGITSIGDATMQSFYYEAYKVIRNITGIGEGHGAYIGYHNPFTPLTHWADGFMTGADRIVIDAHPYVAFDSPASTDPIDTGTGPDAGGHWPAEPCSRWGATFNQTRMTYGVTIAGEWSAAINDCGLFVKGVETPSVFTGNCNQWSDSSAWTDGTKAGLMRLVLTSMDTFRDWFFWTWKVLPAQSGVVEAPLWSYQLGLRGGWMPKDPRAALGACGAPAGPVWSGQFDSWMTGGAGAGQLKTDYPWPPATITNAPGAPTTLPEYTPAGSISTLPVPTFTNRAGKPVVSGNGWFNAQDTIPAPTPIAGCAYPDPWNAQNVAVPAGCTGSGSFLYV